jgi:hypothetical protein
MQYAPIQFEGEPTSRKTHPVAKFPQQMQSGRGVEAQAGMIILVIMERYSYDSSRQNFHYEYLQ